MHAHVLGLPVEYHLMINLTMQLFMLKPETDPAVFFNHKINKRVSTNRNTLNTKERCK